METKVWIRALVFAVMVSMCFIYLFNNENTTLLIVFTSVLFIAGIIYLFTGFRFKKVKDKSQKVIPITFSSKNGEALTSYERGLIVKIQKCPDCQKGDLLEGPSGGMSTNFYCSDYEGCDSKFNLAIADGQLLFADRISDKQPAKKKKDFV